MDREKIKGYLNIAQKAGALIRGGDNLKSYDKKLYLVLVDSAAGKSTQKIAARLEPNVRVIEIDDLAGLIGCNSKIVALKNKGLSEAIEKVI